MPSILGRFTKQSGETLDYIVDYSDWFLDRVDAPASVTATVETGMTVVASSISGETVKVVLSGGTDGTRYKCTVLLTTDAATPIIKEVDFMVTVRDV